MNRKERRRVAKRLGIMDYQRKLSRDKKFNLMQENIIAGKQMHAEFVRKSKLSNQELLAEQEAQMIYERASKIASNEQIAFTDAVEKAKTQLEEEKKLFIKEDKES